MTCKLPDFIRCGRALCSDLAQAERREWWLANGLGGYAAGTVAGMLEPQALPEWLRNASIALGEAERGQCDMQRAR